MAHCININNKEFQKLLSETGENKFSLAAKVSLWQEKNNQLDVIPDKESLEKNYINTLEEKLIDGFLKDFNISATEYNDLKEDIGIDAVTAADLVTKSIAYQSGESILPEVAYFAYNMLGKQNNKIRSELRYLVNKWGKYKERFNYYADIINKKEGFVKDSELWKNKIRDLVILDFLQEKLQQHYLTPSEFKKSLDSKWTKEDFSLWEKIMSWIENLLSSYSSKYKSQKEKLSNLGTSIADEVLNQNYQYFNYNLSEEQVQKYYKNTIESDQFAKDLVETGQNLGLVLTGSLALRKAGTVYRTADETLHDIDWVVPHNLISDNRRNQIILKDIVKYQNSANKETIKKSAINAIDAVKQFTWYEELKRIYPSLKPINIFYGKEHNTFESLTLQTVINGEYYKEAGIHKKTVSFYSKDKNDLSPVKNTREVLEKHAKGDYIEGTGYVVDFFIRLKPNQEQHENYFKLWKEIMIAKLEMGRDKDFIDWKAFVPYMKSKDSFNFNYEGFRHINYNNSENNAFETIAKPALTKISSEETTYLQKEQQSTKEPNDQIDSKIKNFLSSIGVNIQTLSEIRDRDGNLLDAVAKADMLNKIIQVVEGKADITTLSEEAAHFFVEMLGENHPLYKDMLGKITSYAIYRDTVEKYKNDKLYRNSDGTINFNKLKKEAMGKLIMQHIIEQFDEDETVKRVDAVKSWWSKVWDYIKSIFNKGEKINEQLDNPFAISAKKILKSDISDLDIEYKSQEEYLQKSNTGEEAFNKAKDLYNRMTLDDSEDPKTGKKKHIYIKDGKQIIDADGTPRSVNENVVKPWYKKRFPTDKRTEVQKVIDELKAEYGTELHKVIEKIIDRYVNKDTGLVRPTSIPGEKLDVNAEVETKLNTYIVGLIRSYPVGTRFMNEARIFNEKKNLPGTVDLIAFLPDGSADIYDWKSQEVSDGETELKWFKEPAYRLQLEEYREAIEQQFGVTKFNKIRAIPIRTMFKFNKIKGNWVPQDLKNIEIGPIDPSLVPESKEYLLPVVAEKESTGDKELDILISRLNIIYETLSNKNSKDKDKKNIELNKIKKTIRNLQVKKDIKHFTESGLLEIDKYYDKLINNNIDISEILEARDIINVYNEGADYLETLLIKLNKSIETEQDLDKKNEMIALQDKFKTMILRAGSLVNRLEKRGRELADEEANKNGIKGLLNPERVMDYLKRNFRSLSQLETTAAQLFYKIRNKAFQVRDLETENINEKLSELKENLKKWASSKGIPENKIFDGILETDKDGKRTGDFLDIYSDEFRELKKAAIKHGDVAWIRNNTIFDSEAYLAAFKKYQELVESSVYSADPKLDKEKKNAAILKWVETHNGEKSNIATLLPKGNFLKPKDIWWSDKYKELNKPENAPLKAVYDEFQSMLRNSEKAGMIDYEFGFIPSIIKTKMEAFVLGDMGKTGDKNSFLQSLAIDSSVDFGQLDINGKQIKKIPVYYTKDLGADKSFDLFKVFSIWGTHTANYKAMNSIEDTANLLLFVEQNKQSLQTNRYGKVKKGNEPVNNNQINADVLEKFINFYVYGQKMDASSDFSFKIGDTEISATRGLQKVLRYFSIKTLALNPISGTSNLVGGTVNASFIAKKNLYFGDKDWIWGQYKLASRDEKALAFLDYAQVELENEAFYNSNQLSMSDTLKNWTSDKFFIIQRVGDKLVTYPVALAMFKSHMVGENGKIISIRDYVKAKNNYEGIYKLSESERKKIQNKINKEIEDLSETSSLYAKSKKVNGKLEIEGVDRKSDTFIEFRNKIKKMNKSIIGNASQEDINQFRIGMLGQMVMQFRSWIPGLVTERFGDLAYDTDLETYNYGKARVFFKHFIDKKWLPLLGELVTGFGDNAIERAKERYAEMVIRRREQGDMNFEERMSETQFIDMYIGNLRSMTREVLVMLAFLSLLLWAHTVPPDEDKEHNGARKLMAKAMDKYYNEVAFFYNPTEFQSLIKSPIPITGLFTDIANFGENTIKEVWGLGTNNEKLVKKSHPMKYFNKMIPVARQAQDIFALFDKEFRTDWGIK